MHNRNMKIKLVILAASMMLAGSVQGSPLFLNAAGNGSITEFTDANSRGGWEKTSGNGTIVFVDGEGDEGYMKLHSDNNTIYAATEAEVRKDGYIEMDMTMSYAPNGARMGIIFRYNSPTDWEGIAVDSGNWLWITGQNGWGNLDYTEKSFVEEGESHRVRIEYRGQHVKVILDGTNVVVDQEVSEFGKANAGKIGMRLWGIVSENYDNEFCIDNVAYGDISENKVTINPSALKIPYEEAGIKDYEIVLNTEVPELKALKNGSETLKTGKDYEVKGTVVTLKKEYIAALKEKNSVNLIFEFADGQSQILKLSIEKKEAASRYVRDFADGIDGMEKVSGNGTMKLADQSLNLQGNGLFIDQNSKALKNQEVEFTYDPLSNQCNYGVVLRYVSPTEYIYVGPSGQVSQHYTNWGIYGPNGQKVNLQDSGFILEGRTEPYKVKVRIIEDVITIFVDQEEIYNGRVSGLTGNAGKTGFRTTQNTGMSIQYLIQETAEAPEEVTGLIECAQISSDIMTVEVDREFPRVIGYTMKTGEQVGGQEIPLHQLEINNRLYTPIVSSEVSENWIIYYVTEPETEISFEVVFEVQDNVLLMEIQNVEEPKEKLYTLNFPGHSLVSMSSKEKGGKLTVNNFQSETKYVLSSAQATEEYRETSLAVLSNDQVAAAISGDSYKNRHEIAYRTFAVGDHTSTGLWMNEYTYRGLDGELIDYINEDGSAVHVPWTKVAIATDRNGDGKVDYQDGAIALREDCMKRKIGAEIATDSWNMIAMDVGSQAQYPFLRILDNIKKMSLATDQFRQNIYIKGYQSEGHDSSHPDFANYNQRAGGLKDFKTLLEQSEDYNATIGIHINHTEVYPEAPQYEKLKTNLNGWSWYDSSMQIIRENDGLDKTEEGLDGRLAQLYDTDTESMIDTTYVDVFFGTRWPMYNLIKNINGEGRALGLGTEYTDEFVSYSTFAHHIVSDFGGAGNLVRFVNNDQADIFTYHQLFRGASNRNSDEAGINGWQTAKNLNNALQAFYEKILPNKFLAQYPVMQYENDTKAVLGENLEVVTAMKNGVNVITKDGLEVANGTKIFIPWEMDGEADGKIYHWNREGGNSTWSLPLSWGDVSSVVIYELSDCGKGEPVTLAVKNGQVTIDAEAKTGYVLYKSEAETFDTADTMEWSVGSLVKDMGFDAHNFDEWEPSSTSGKLDHIIIENNHLGNSHLYVKGREDGQVSQVIIGLKKGQSYSASVWCIVTDGKTASLEVKNGKEIVSNEMTESTVINSVCHSDKYQTYAQRMQVRFVAKGDMVVLSLKGAQAESETAAAEFDDVRIVEVKADTNPEPDKYLYWEDFENVDQGFGIFVSTVDGNNNSLSDRSHLSQKNPVNPEYTPDVIDGEFSLKVRSSDYMRTIPSDLRLEPNTEYTIGMEYKASGKNAFVFAVKSDQAKKAGDTEHAVLASVTASEVSGTLELSFTTGDYEDYYIDLTKRNSSDEYCIDNVYVEGTIPVNETHEVLRLSGKTRYETGIAAAEELKEVLGVEKFETAIIATGKNFADALSGSYLAAAKNAPILLTDGNKENVTALHDYIKANVKEGAVLYILGGEGAVPKNVETVKGYRVKRLSGKNRYETNLAILNEAGIRGQDTLLVATGKEFADSLSASATAKPILLVKPGTALNDSQKKLVKNFSDSKVYVIGGTGAVSASVEKELNKLAENVERLAGSGRYETSVIVAETLFTDPEAIVVAYGKKFPDGLCGGPLAAAIHAPLILTREGNEAEAMNYVKKHEIRSGYVLGGTGVLKEETVEKIFSLNSAQEIR